MLERPHLTRLMGAASVIAALALLFRVVAAIISVMAADRDPIGTIEAKASRSPGDADELAAAIRGTIRSLRRSASGVQKVIGIDGSSSSALAAPVCMRVSAKRSRTTRLLKERSRPGRGCWKAGETSLSSNLRPRTISVTCTIPNR